MKLIEALKLTKDLARKAEDLRAKIANCSADMDFETPVYPDQATQVQQWLQAHSDITNEILKLRIGIQKTNLITKVKIKLGEHYIEKSIAEWVHRRKDLAAMELLAWKCLGDKGLKEAVEMKQSNGQPFVVKIRRYYDPRVRDAKAELYRSEPSIIDGTLETVNAVTDLIE